MKTLLALLIPLSLLFFNPTPNENNVIIKGNIKNAGQEFVSLGYFPRLRGIFSFDNFKTIGASTDAKGHFELQSNNITDGADYVLEFNNKYIPLILFTGDNLTFNVDFKNVEPSFFATGKGSGKINVLRLEQFDYVPFKNNWTIAQFNTKNDSIVTAKLSLLDAIYKKKTNDITVAKANNKTRIEQIIKQSPLSQKEYDFIKNQITFQRYYVVDFILKNPALSTTIIDFKNPAFNSFNKNEYKKIKNLNAAYSGGILDKILQVEYLKNKQIQDPTITYKNWNGYINTPEYNNWVSAYLKKEFTPEVHDQYYSSIMAFLMTTGEKDKERYKYLIENCTDQKYLHRIDGFENLLENGLSDKKYNLNSDNFTLNEAKLEALLKNHEGRNTLIIFWSAAFAGSSILYDVPAFANFKNKQKIDVINICIDKTEQKPLWAARIIDNEWMMPHFFMPIENNESTLNKFSNKKIDTFCFGGATYSIIDKDGEIHNNLKNPLKMTNEELKAYIK